MLEVNDIWEKGDQGGCPKMAKIQDGVKPDIPRYQSTSVFPTSSDTGRIVKAFFHIAAPQRRAAKHLGHTWFFGKTFFADPLTSSSTPSYPQDLHQCKSSEEPLHSSTIEKCERPEQNQDLRCHTTVSQRFGHLQWRRLFKESWGRATTTADF